MKEYFERLYLGSKDKFVNDVEENISHETKRFIITANPETFMIGKGNKVFDRILKSREVTIVPDGIGIVKGANILGIKIKERITGVDLCEEILRILNQQSKSIYLFGAQEAVGNALCERIKTQYPNINLLGYTDGYVQDRESVMKAISMQEPDVVLVALGVPQQELLIAKHFKSFRKGIFIGVGGSFDVLSGLKRRAPHIFVKLNLEWLYRITKEPKRIKRFYISNIKFIQEIYRLKRRSNSNGEN